MLTERYELAIIGEKLGALASAAEVAGRPWKESDWVKNAGEHRLSDGTRVSPRIAKAMMTIFRTIWKMTRSRGNGPRE